MLQLMLENKTVLITGASSGIGRGIALACANAGAKCILVGRNLNRLVEVQNLCGGTKHEIRVFDVTDFSRLKDFIASLTTLDGLVLCAGAGDGHTPLKFLTPEFVDRLFAVNTKAPILMLSNMAKQKKLNNSASVIFISSVASIMATPAHSLYCATKGALTSFMRGAALDLAGRKIRVNAIAPGMVNTPLIEYANITEEQRKANEARYPLKRYGNPEDIAGCAIYLLSDASSWVTGQQFVLDGGLTVGG